MIFRIYYKIAGGHTHMRVFAGSQEGALGKCGDLTMRNEEFKVFAGRFGQHVTTPPGMEHFIQFRPESS